MSRIYIKLKRNFPEINLLTSLHLISTDFTLGVTKLYTVKLSLSVPLSSGKKLGFCNCAFVRVSCYFISGSKSTAKERKRVEIIIYINFYLKKTTYPKGGNAIFKDQSQRFKNTSPLLFTLNKRTDRLSS